MPLTIVNPAPARSFAISSVIRRPDGVARRPPTIATAVFAASIIAFAYSSILWLSLPLLYLVGFGFEVVGDRQLARFRADPSRRGQVLDWGLWRYTRHPNYFGELLCWWGVFLFTAGQLAGLDLALGLVGPLSITGVLVFLTGIPPLEASADAKWGADPAYQAYKRATPVLVPWPRKGSWT